MQKPLTRTMVNGEWGHKKRSVRLEHTLESKPKLVFVLFDGHQAIDEHSNLLLEEESVDRVADQIVLYLCNDDHRIS